MKLMRSMKLCLMGLCVIGAALAAAASSAVAALPEVGRCVPAEKEIVGGKNHWKGAYKGKTCIAVNPTHEGHWEWSPGPGKEAHIEGTGLPSETVTLEPASGTHDVLCTNGSTEGEITGAKSEKVKFTLIGCEDTTSKVKCQNYAPETGEPKPVPGKIQSQELTGTLGFISQAKKRAGWDVKPEKGPFVVEYECGETLLIGTKYLVEGSFISRIAPPNKMSQERLQYFEAKHGIQVPQSFEGAGEKDNLKAKVLEGASERNEALGYIALEGETSFEELEFKVS